MALSRIAVLTGIAVALVLSGCTAEAPDSSPSPGSSWHPDAQPQTTWEYSQVMVDCLRDGGWEIEVSSDDPTELHPSIPPGQDDRYAEAITDCSDAIGPLGNPNPSDAFIRAMYDLQSGVHDCLAEHGYVVADPPSFATYADELRSGSLSAWDPRAGLQGPQFAASEQDCPRPEYPLN